MTDSAPEEKKPKAAMLVVFLVIAAADTFVLKLLWNWLCPILWGWPLITFWQALGLHAFMFVLFYGYLRFMPGWKK